MKYMLDTNMIIYAMKADNDELKRLLNKFSKSEFCISSIVMAELEFGASNSSDPEKNRDSMYSFLFGCDVLPFGTDAAREYGDIRANLKRKGMLIGPNDTLIAAHAKSLGLTLVTNNTREFERVEGLKVENWLN